MNILIATQNKHKVKEISKILNLRSLKILSLLNFPNSPKIIENGTTFKENAIKKAKVVAKKFSLLTLADDSGLEVSALEGRPGVRSARYAGPRPTSQKLCRKLLKEMQNQSERSAKFVCVIAIATPEGKVKIARGECRGKISFEMKGSHGFGYDPVFIPFGYKRTFAQMSPRMKNRLSHRGRAIRKARKLILCLART